MISEIKRKRFFAKIVGYEFIAPAIILLLLLFGYPIFNLIKISFSRISLATYQTVEWVGLNNYLDVVLNPSFLRILLNTFIFTVGSVGFQIGLGFIVAILLNTKIKGITFFRIVIMLPYVTPGVVIAVLWVFFYDPSFGLFNVILTRVFGVEKFSMLSYSSTVLIGVILTNIWFLFPFSAMMILAGLQGISPQLYGVAKVDGASRIQLLRYITIPLLRPVLSMLVILQGIWAINSFALIWVMTRGGPGYSSTVLGIFTYQYSFQFLEFEKAAATAVILTSIALVLGYIYIRAIVSEKGKII